MKRAWEEGRTKNKEGESESESESKISTTDILHAYIIIIMIIRLFFESFNIALA